MEKLEKSLSQHLKQLRKTHKLEEIEFHHGTERDMYSFDEHVHTGELTVSLKFTKNASSNLDMRPSPSDGLCFREQDDMPVGKESNKNKERNTDIMVTLTHEQVEELHELIRRRAPASIISYIETILPDTFRRGQWYSLKSKPKIVAKYKEKGTGEGFNSNGQWSKSIKMTQFSEWSRVGGTDFDKLDKIAEAVRDNPDINVTR